MDDNFAPQHNMNAEQFIAPEFTVIERRCNMTPKSPTTSCVIGDDGSEKSPQFFFREEAVTYAIGLKVKLMNSWE